jgi:hypothetical protein
LIIGAVLVINQKIKSVEWLPLSNFIDNTHLKSFAKCNNS